MLRKIYGGLVALTLALFSSLAISATPASAQAAFYDDAPTNYTDTGNNVAFTASITVSAPYTVTSIEALTRVTVAHNQKFFIMDASTNAVVYVSPPKAFAADGPSATYKVSDLFSAVTLQPGKTYYIGSIADQTAIYPFRFPAAAVTQGVVTNGVSAGFGSNGGANNYAIPRLGVSGGAQVPIRLNTIFVPAPAPVPTMTEWAMILLGLMLAGGAAVLVQRRQMAT